MKIVHVIPVLTKGGAERVVVDLANHAAAAGDEVCVLAAVPAPSHLLADRLRPEVSLRFIAPQGKNPRQAYVRLLPWLLRNRSWLFGQDVVHCHLTLGAVFGSLLQGFRRLSGREKPAVVETYHAVGMAIPDRDRTFHAKMLATRDGAALVAEDPYWKSFIRSHPARLVKVIPNGIAPAAPTGRLEAYRKQAGIPDKAFVIGSVGRLVRDRRPDLLLEVFADLAGRVPGDPHLLLAGDGRARGALEKQARDLGLEGRVHFPGLAVDPSEPLSLIDLYLTVNVGPVTGIAALEAAMAGLPIVALQLDPTYRATSSDWIWSSNDPGEVAAHAATLVSDRATLADLGAKQQAHARAHHSIDAMALAYKRLYEEALARRSRGS